jgi:hypothetical protein
MGKDEVQRRLMKELSDAQSAYNAANARFHMLVKEVPSEIPAPDGSLRILEAGIESRVNLERYTRAMKRYSEFAIRGTIPEDLRDIEDSNGSTPLK